MYFDARIKYDKVNDKSEYRGGIGMGLFSKKAKEVDYDPVASTNNKVCMRRLFNEAVSEGDSYTIMECYSSTSKFEQGIWFNKTTTSFYFYILGYRRSDNQVILVQVDSNLTEHSEAFFVDMEALADIVYYPKIEQAALVYRKGYGPYGEILNLGDLGRKEIGITNLYQKEERNDFLNFLEEYRHILERKGCKLSKWKR